MRKVLCFALLVCLCYGMVQGGIYYPRYWGLDAQIRWVQTSAWVTVPTGCWWGGYGYNYGGYNWPAHVGCYYPYTGYYAGYYGSSWGWNAPSWYYGFTDYFSYRATFTWPRIVYSWSRYWDPQDTGYTMDFYTEADADGKAMAIGQADLDGQMRSIGDVVEMGDHHFSYNGGQYENKFTTLQWITASPDAMQAYLAAEGFDAATIAEILEEQILKDAFASNFDGSDYGTDLIGVQWAQYPIPEPATILCVGLGSLLVMHRRKKS
jgi:hypothetical protein